MAPVGLPGPSLQTEQGGEALLGLVGAVALLLVGVGPKWEEHLVKEGGKWVAHVACSKAICGTMDAALLAHKGLAKLFMSWDFVMGPHGPCAWGKMANGEQMATMHRIGDPLFVRKGPGAAARHIGELEEGHGAKAERVPKMPSRSELMNTS